MPRWESLVRQCNSEMATNCTQCKGGGWKQSLQANQTGSKPKTKWRRSQVWYLADASGSWGRLREALWLASGCCDRVCDWSEKRVVCRDTREVKGRWVLRMIRPLGRQCTRHIYLSNDKTIFHQNQQWIWVMYDYHKNNVSKMKKGSHLQTHWFKWHHKQGHNSNKHFI